MLLGVMSVVGILSALVVFLYGQKIEVSIDQDDLARVCPPSSPIFVRVKNWTFSTVKNVNFRMEVYKGERSHNLLSNSNYILDYVIKPFSSRSGCFSDEYTDNLIVRSDQDQQYAGEKYIRINTSKIVYEVNLASEFGSSHSVYITNIEYQMLY